jgi:adenylosuccinate synthase
MFKRIIVISGPVGAGKSKLATALTEFGLRVVKTRELLLTMTRTRNDRGDLQAAGERLDARTGGRWLADALAREAEILPDDAEVIVDSVRIRNQIDALRDKFGARVIHVHVTAPVDELARRYQARATRSGAEFKSYDEVRANKTERNLGKLEALADIAVDTDRCTEQDVLVRVASHLGYFGRSYERLVDVLVGAQYGSEGKGNIAAYLASEYEVLVRVGGPNAGHTVFLGGDNKYAFHHLPSGTLHTNAELILGPGATLYVPKLMAEIAECRVTADRLSIDPNAMIIDDADIAFEKRTLKKSIASTAQGVGVATARKVLRGAFPRREKGKRKGKVQLAGNIHVLKPYIRETRALLDDAFRAGKRVFMEGTQGTGLSLHHGPYPHVTSRETTASGCLADAGIAPTRVRRIVMVCRTYPIRVKNSITGKSSGPMDSEITYAQLATDSGIPEAELRKTEMTTTTKRQRRVGMFEWALLRKAASLNGPTDIALTFADYLSINNRTAQRFEQLTPDTIRFIEEVESVAGSPVSLISTRFGARAIIDRRKWW